MRRAQCRIHRHLAAAAGRKEHGCGGDYDPTPPRQGAVLPGFVGGGEIALAPALDLPVEGDIDHTSGTEPYDLAHALVEGDEIPLAHWETLMW